MSFLTALINLFNTDEEGQGLAEYALILALIAIVAIVALLFLGGQISTILSQVGLDVAGIAERVKEAIKSSEPDHRLSEQQRARSPELTGKLRIAR